MKVQNRTKKCMMMWKQWHIFHIICYDQLCLIPRMGQAVSIKIYEFCQDLKGNHFQLLEAMSLYHDVAGMWVMKCREDCYDFHTAKCQFYTEGIALASSSKEL